MQVSAGDKDNEINAAPVLLRSIDLCGKVVVGDAIHTQRALSVQILAAKADYLWFVKENQPMLHEDIVTLFEADRQTVLGGVVERDFKTFRTVEKSHGRIESREITVSSELKGYSDWPGLEQVFRLERRRVDYRDGKGVGKQETEMVYGLTSLSREEAPPERLLSLARTYWGIENGLHGRRDVTFREDSTRLTRGKAGRVMASINNLVISLLRLSGHTNLAEARRRWDADLTLALGRSPASSFNMKEPCQAVIKQSREHGEPRIVHHSLGEHPSFPLGATTECSGWRPQYGRERGGSWHTRLPDMLTAAQTSAKMPVLGQALAASYHFVSPHFTPQPPTEGFPSPRGRPALAPNAHLILPTRPGAIDTPSALGRVCKPADTTTR